MSCAGRRHQIKLLELILFAMNIYTRIGNVLVSSDKEKATLTPLEPRYPTAMVVALQL